MNRIHGTAASLFAMALALLLWGCGGPGGPTPSFNSATGTHPKDWMQGHWAEFIRNPDQCRTCHGSTTNPAAAGGVSQVSCFTCHPKGPSHQSRWGTGMQHGRLGAQLPPSTTAGFAYCAKCHGADYATPIGTSPSCTSCHAKAPHPDKPWRSTSAAASDHTLTDAGNASECFKCHADGANSSLKPASKPTAGTPPGCFNNTLCHERRF